MARFRSPAFCVGFAALLPLLLLLGFTATPTRAQNPPIPFTNVSAGIYLVPDLSDSGKFFTTSDVVSPPAMIGTFPWAPAPWSGPHFKFDATKGDTDPDFLTLRVVLPHSGDNWRYGCGVLRSVNDEGESLAGAVVLVERQGPNNCAFAEKATRAATAGARAVMYHGCPTIATGGSCRDTLSIVTVSASIPITQLYVGTQVGYKMRDYLLARRDAFYAARALNASIAAAASSSGMAASSSLSSSSTGAAAPCSGAITPVTPVDTSQPLLIRVPTTGALDPAERSALSLMLSSNTLRQDVSKLTGVSSLRGWTSANLDSPTLDPCLDRMVGIYCEHGHIVSIYWNNLGFAGMLSSGFGALSQLRGFDGGTNSFTGDVAPEWCALAELRFFAVNRGTLTSLPDCMGTLPKLHHLSANSNQLTKLPTTLMQLAGSLRLLQMSTNKLGSVPGVPAAPVDWFKLPFLWRVDISSNPAFGSSLGGSSAPYLAGNSFLDAFFASDAGLTGVMSAQAFDNCTSLVQLSLNQNALSGPLPSLERCGVLRELVLNNNAFSSSIPASWSSLQCLQIAKLQFNRIVSPASTFSSMFNVSVLWLSNNRLALPGPSRDVGSYITGITQNALRELDLSSNLLAGPMGANTLTPNSARSLAILLLSNNSIESMSSDLFGLSTLTALDLSSNNLTGSLPVAIPSGNLQSLNLQRNPRLQIWPLPSWTVAQTEMLQSADGLYSCPVLSSNVNPQMSVRVDASFTSFRGCVCARGLFGYPPLCAPVPLTATVSPFGSITSAEVGDSFAGMLQTQLGRGNGSLAAPPGITDEIYGRQRLTLGISTSFEIDLSTIYWDRSNQTVVHFSADASAIGAMAPLSRLALLSDPQRFQPVRAMTLRLHLNPRTFDALTDKIDIFEGGADLKGERLLSIDGIDVIPPANVSDADAVYGDALAALGSPHNLLEIQALTSSVSVHFSSRDPDGMHFFISYRYAFDCPQGFELPSADAPRCVPARPMYVVSEALRATVIAVAAVAVLVAMGVGVVLLAHWQSSLMRAASRRFLMLMLAGLILLGCGSLLYAVSPTPSHHLSNLVCVGRAWLTGLPLALILGVLLAKNWRVVSIFTSNKLVVVARKVGDARVLRTASMVVLGEVALLIAFTVEPLSRAERSTLGGGVGSLSESWVVQCSREQAFYPWLAVQLSYFLLLMLASLMLAWKTRGLPSAFNEASHIVNACLLLLCFGVIILPLIIVVQDKPEASMLLQGLGQAFLCLLLTAMLFAPKIYYLVAYNLADQKALLTAPASILAGVSVLEQSKMPTPLSPTQTLQGRTLAAGQGTHLKIPGRHTPILAHDSARNSPINRSPNRSPQLQPAPSQPSVPAMSGSGRRSSAAELRRMSRNDMNRTAASALHLLSVQTSPATVVPFNGAGDPSPSGSPFPRGRNTPVAPVIESAVTKPPLNAYFRRDSSARNSRANTPGPTAAGNDPSPLVTSAANGGGGSSHGTASPPWSTSPQTTTHGLPLSGIHLPMSAEDNDDDLDAMATEMAERDGVNPFSPRPQFSALPAAVVLVNPNNPNLVAHRPLSARSSAAVIGGGSSSAPSDDSVQSFSTKSNSSNEVGSAFATVGKQQQQPGQIQQHHSHHSVQRDVVSPSHLSSHSSADELSHFPSAVSPVAAASSAVANGSAGAHQLIDSTPVVKFHPDETE